MFLLAEVCFIVMEVSKVGAVRKLHEQRNVFTALARISRKAVNQSSASMGTYFLAYGASLHSVLDRIRSCALAYFCFASLFHQQTKIRYIYSETFYPLWFLVGISEKLIRESVASSSHFLYLH